MLRSMTAYGRKSALTPCGRDITVEIKSVNSKFLDLSVKLPRQLSPLEARIKSAVTERGISRGRVEMFITYRRADSGNTTVELDRGYTEGYIAALRELRDRYGLKDDISVMSVAANHDIFTVADIGEDLDEVWVPLKDTIDGAIDEFLSERCREGENLRADLLLKLDALRDGAKQIAELSEKDVLGARDRIRARLQTILEDNRITIDENRVLTECAILADKLAIDEELVRLASHISAIEQMLASDEPVGRKLDFQLQEASREINTIGSKCQNADIAKIVVKMKNEAEKIREQVQNIE
mgnify:CR=1 FL=1